MLYRRDLYHSYYIAGVYIIHIIQEGSKSFKLYRRDVYIHEKIKINK
jgi:hypothetical protein